METKTATETLVLKDQAGAYYLLARETLEQGRVPAERQAELEERMGADAAGFGIDLTQRSLIIVVCGRLLSFNPQPDPPGTTTPDLSPCV